jgi:hypothetical protein
MMRKHDPQVQEEGFHSLLPRAAEFVDDLLEDFRREADHGLKCWFLQLIGEARNSKAFKVLCEEVNSPDESLRDWAIIGLQQLGTRDARRALFDAGVRNESRRTRR